LIIEEEKYKSLIFRQGFWTREDFRQFLNALFSNKRRPYLILSDRIDEYFRETDYNHDGKIDYDEFIQAWRTTIKCVNLILILQIFFELLFSNQ
jgi:hypothetical protein